MTWEDAIESYKTYLILEKSLSSNSVEAYLNDIKKLAKYCADKHHVTTPDAISYDHLKDYLMFINEVGVTNRTQARCISSIRSFYKFLVFDGQLENNPTKLLEAPKIGRKLPNILTTEEIDAMLNSVEMYKPEARNALFLRITRFRADQYKIIQHQFPSGSCENRREREQRTDDSTEQKCKTGNQTIYESIPRLPGN